MKKNLKVKSIVLCATMAALSANSFAGTRASKYATVNFTAKAPSTVTIYTSSQPTNSKGSTVKINDLDHTVTNDETFSATTGSSITLGYVNYGINGGEGLFANVQGTVTGPNGNALATGRYYFPDVDSNHGKVETSETDSDGAVDVDTSGGGVVSELQFSSGWAVNVNTSTIQPPLVLGEGTIGKSYTLTNPLLVDFGYAASGSTITTTITASTQYSGTLPSNISQGVYNSSNNTIIGGLGAYGINASTANATITSNSLQTQISMSNS